MSKSNNPRATLSFVSLGCSKNLVDSERMLGLLAQDGFALVPEGQQADLVIVNTCGFIDAARQESCGVIEEMLERKRAGTVKGVVVAGCLAERQKDLLLEQFPEVDQVVGVFGREEIARVSERILGGLHEQRTLFRPAPVQAQDDRARLRITPRHLAYLKVSEGCDRLCTFCAIPYMRGKHVTKPIERVVEEARELAGDGVRELILVAQDMTYYGVDLYGRPRLADLLRELDQIEELDWIRILYNYPSFFTDELYEVLGGSRRIIPYLDMPLQHINDRLLKVMNRRHTRAETEAIIARLRATIPGLVLRTTFIVGFPGETEAEFAELLDFVAADQVRTARGLRLLVRARHPGGKAPGPACRRDQGRAPGARHGRPAADCGGLQPDARGPDARRPDRRPRTPGQEPVGRPDLRRRPRRGRPDARPGGRPGARRPGRLPDRLRPGLRPRRPADLRDSSAPQAGPPQAPAAQETTGFAHHPGRYAMSRDADSGAMASTATVPAKPRFWNVPNTLTVGRLALAVVVFALIALTSMRWRWRPSSSPHCPMHSTATSPACSSRTRRSAASSTR